MKLKRTEILDLNAALTDLKGFDYNKNFNLAYTMAKNRRAVASEVDAFNEVVATPKDLAEKGEAYNKELHEIWKKYADKDDNGEPVVKPDAIEGQNPYLVTKNIFKMSAEIGELRKTYSALFTGVSEHEKRVNAMLKEEVEIDLVSVELSDSFAGIDQGKMGALLPIVKEASGKMKE